MSAEERLAALLREVIDDWIAERKRNGFEGYTDSMMRARAELREVSVPTPEPLDLRQRIAALPYGMHGNVEVIARSQVFAAINVPTPEPSARLREAAEAVIAQAETDDDFDGQYVDYLVPFAAVDALRAALVATPQDPGA